MEMLFYSLEHGQFSSHPLEDFRVIMIILEGFWWCCCSLRHATFLRITIVRSNVGKIPGSLTLQRKGWKKWQPSVKNKPLTSIISYILRKWEEDKDCCTSFWKIRSKTKKSFSSICKLAKCNKKLLLSSLTPAKSFSKIENESYCITVCQKGSVNITLWICMYMKL